MDLNLSTPPGTFVGPKPPPVPFPTPPKSKSSPPDTNLPAPFPNGAFVTLNERTPNISAGALTPVPPNSKTVDVNPLTSFGLGVISAVFSPILPILFPDCKSSTPLSNCDLCEIFNASRCLVESLLTS